MTTNHIDQLAQWWEGAEHAAFEEDDLLIARFGDRPVPYEVYPAGCASTTPSENVRVLERAPKPKPAWHDAVAVIASTDNLTRQVWERDGDGWYGTDGYRVDADALNDVTPLIEAKVTDEMARTVLNGYYEMDGIGHDWPADTVTLMRLALAAALGLETE